MVDWRQRVASIESGLTPALVERTVHELLGQEQGKSRGIGALSLVLGWLGDVALTGEEMAWAYARLKPTLVDTVARAFVRAPELRVFLRRRSRDRT